MSAPHDHVPMRPPGTAKRQKAQPRPLPEPVRSEIQELCRGLDRLRLRRGQRAELDAARLLEISQTLQDLGELYWANVALEMANQAARP